MFALCVLFVFERGEGKQQQVCPAVSDEMTSTPLGVRGKFGSSDSLLAEVS